MRQYRGKRKDNGKWVYGSLMQIEVGCFIIPFDATLQDRSIGTRPQPCGVFEYEKVIPETVGQSTGLKDKNDKEIYEGDRVRQRLENGLVRGGEIVFREGVFRVGGDDGSYDYLHNLTRFVPEYRLEVIGNIHEELK